MTARRATVLAGVAALATYGLYRWGQKRLRQEWLARGAEAVDVNEMVSQMSARELIAAGWRDLTGSRAVVTEGA